MMTERMPPLDPSAMSQEQSKAAAALAAGPRGGVRGPFIALLRSPELMDRLQKVGEYLRYNSALEARLSEFVMLVVARHWTQQFEWCVHYPLALKAGVAQASVDGLAQGRRPPGMAEDEALAYDLCDELLRTHGLSDATYGGAVARFGERGVVDLLGLIGYFSSVSMVLNAAHTPPPRDAAVRPLQPLPM
jgi:4-carboxymuconolactone decarboxylase